MRLQMMNCVIPVIFLFKLSCRSLKSFFITFFQEMTLMHCISICVELYLYDNHVTSLHSSSTTLMVQFNLEWSIFSMYYEWLFQCYLYYLPIDTKFQWMLDNHEFWYMNMSLNICYRINEGSIVFVKSFVIMTYLILVIKKLIQIYFSIYLFVCTINITKTLHVYLIVTQVELQSLL